MIQSDCEASVAKNRSSINVSMRLPRDLDASVLATTLDDIDPPLDLTSSNPTRAGLVYPHDAIADALGAASRLPYAPDALGALSAREFLATKTGDRPEHIMLTASTSEAYAIAIKTFVSPGEAVAVPRPSYPLVPHLAELEGVRTLGWSWHDGSIDMGSLRAALDGGARMVVVVSPNNPTGTIATADELRAVATLCAARGAVLAIDAVFAPYAHEVPDVPRDLPGTTLVMDGLSKRAGLPQLKVAWTSVRGDEASRAIAALSWTNDAYLSCGIAQQALPALWECGGLIAAQIRERIAVNRAALLSAFADVSAVSIPTIRAGWTALMRVPRVCDEDAWVLACARGGVRVQPGYFYDVEGGAHLVVSLLTAPTAFEDGVRRIAACVRATAT